ncbi:MULTISPECIES: hypothetical protein [Bifidobacterium]|uniref:UDP-N-acetylmuramyl peptide synthase n=1 Tax=Bifidobacterium myosotis TaxID=1630166 RepID=A0A261FFJ7_9BIFI|nr:MULTISPECIES: hypothetical protein [Bifidobacterium]KAA8827785.1 hypothetical protein EMO91_08125 [Bifidobacterium myosotis]OZG57743.1 hypothetical protein BMYO_1816 [Bifidobacterium myosotis]TPF93185.1 hypothetical protein BG22_07730 [Bifidobacterium sp. UTBIF-78]
MSAVSESITQRMTLGLLARRYGLEIDPPFAVNVTITSLSDTIDTVIPGSLFICGAAQGADLPRAAQSGAYAALVPSALKGQCPDAGIPLLYGDLDDRMMGTLAAGFAGSPSSTMAVFVVAGDDEDVIDADAHHLADFLHMLGNPVALVSASGSTSMTRTLNLSYPLGILDMQRVLAVCAEDGVAAVIIAMNPSTLKPHALESVNVDVLGAQRSASGPDLAELRDRYAFVADGDLALTRPTRESDDLAADSPAASSMSRLRHMSLAIAMVLAAGVRRNNVRSALRVASNLT